MTEPVRLILQNFSGPTAAAADLLVSSVWEGVALVACVALVLRCAPGLSATVRSRLWTGVLLVVVLLPVFSMHRAAHGTGTQGYVHIATGWGFGIVAAWSAFSAVRLLQLAGSAVRLGVIARRAVPLATEEAVGMLLRRSRRGIQLCVSSDVTRPSAVGFLRPRILLPLGMQQELSVPELQHVVVHELEHLRRGDDWTNLLQKLSLALFPLHPALHWLDRRLCIERELACDDGVLQVLSARKAYAACLARLAEDSMVRRGVSLALGLLGVRARHSELSRRVHRILGRPGVSMGPVQAAAATAMLFAAVVGGSLLLARSPELISFGAAPESSAAMVSNRQDVAAGDSVGKLLQDELPARATLVKAVVPQAGPTVLHASFARRKSMMSPAMRGTRLKAEMRMGAPALRRVELPQHPGNRPALVYTEWQSTTASAHLTFALAQWARPIPPPESALSSTVSHQAYPTYAAVPVQGGWLLIQL